MNNAGGDGGSIENLINLSRYPSNWHSEYLLRSLDIAFQNQLTNESPRASQPPEIKITLRDHQRAILAAMAEKENCSRKGIPYKNTETFTNYGILGDEVGTGKSLVVLSHIAAMKRNTNASYEQKLLLNHSCKNLFTLYTKTYNESTQAQPSLIVVPHTIYRQWQDYCKNQTTLNVFFAKSNKDLEAASYFSKKELKQVEDISGSVGYYKMLEGQTRKIAEQIRTSDAVLVSNTLYHDLAQYAETNHISWKRVFLDEADTIHITYRSNQLNAPFVWFITATWPNFLFNGHYIRTNMITYYQQNVSTFTPELGKWLQSELGININTPLSGYNYNAVWLKTRSSKFLEDYLNDHILRAISLVICSREFLEESRLMPIIKNETILCSQPLIYRAVAGFVNDRVKNMLHAGDVEGALNELGVSADTPVDLIEAVTNERNKELDRLRKTLAFKESIDYATPQAKETALNSLKTKISSVEEQIKTFNTRLQSLQTEECPICYDNPSATNSATLTPCCHRVFCGACILNSLARGLHCPMCRAVIQAKQLIKLVDKKESKKKNDKDSNKLLTKPRQLLKILKENPNARVLVFSRYENPFVQLERDCETEGITYHTLRGNKDVIASTIKSFEKGEKRVLFLPVQSAGAGLNLVSATHIVLLHAMTPEEEKQAVGRAYRLGRTEPLHVLKLLNEDEQS
jgi:SNF2 family DNA or RNA helicase